MRFEPSTSTFGVLERIHAIWLLATCLLATLFESFFAPLTRKRRGLRAFQRSYALDRLPPLTPEERRTLPTLSGCIACGLCDLGEGLRVARSSGVYAGTMDLMLASSRSMPDFDAAMRSFATVPEARLAELERRCPARIPMQKVAAFVRAKGLLEEEEVRASQGAIATKAPRARGRRANAERRGN
ncbi:hypothetical protein LVJ94_18600 [Pendulispora rubella]|uniref:Uncharacterized protein n=1 Tax=Pendulispora rubella TaxID=2741070 RepID=A0ABZ2LE72_9BACT